MIIFKEKSCENCWETFTPKRRQAKFCSEKCSKDFAKKQAVEKTKEILKTGITNNLYLRLRFEIFKRDGFRCHYCGRGVNDGTTLEIDHIIPKSKGGKLSSENLVTACYECNIGKRDVLLTEFQIFHKVKPI